MKTTLFALCLLLSIYCLAQLNRSDKQPLLPATDNYTKAAEPDYEHDLTERCKDWIFYRNKAYRLVQEGDNEGAIEAGKMMRRYYNDLKLYFSVEEISAELFRLEQEKMAKN